MSKQLVPYPRVVSHNVAKLIAVVCFFVFAETVLAVAPWRQNGGTGQTSLTSTIAKNHPGTATSGATWVATEMRRPPLLGYVTNHMQRRSRPPLPAWEQTSSCTYWAVITSIFGPTKLAVQLSRIEGWCTVIVGDQKSPAKADWLRDFNEIGGNASSLHFLSANDQDSLPFATARAVPWNHFGRKNVGYVYAIARGAQVIYDTDDDNELHEPYPERRLTRAAAALMSDSTRCDQVCGQQQPVYNPYPGFFSSKATALDLPFWPRGFPLDRIRDETTYNASTCHAKCTTISILQSLADNDPDVDAIYRMTRSLPLTFEAAPRILSLPAGTMAPFNAQATLYHYDAFWGLLLPVTVHGRVADILRSYLVQRLMWGTGQTLAFSSPLVRQVRNAHKHLADFVAEQPLYTKAGELVRHLLALPPPGQKHLAHQMTDLTTNIYQLGILEAPDIRLVQAWVNDLGACGYEWPQAH